MKNRNTRKRNKTVKKKEADIATFKLIINNQGQFIVEKSLYPKEKINVHFKKENSGLVSSFIRESNIKFDELTEIYELLLQELS